MSTHRVLEDDDLTLLDLLASEAGAIAPVLTAVAAEGADEPLGLLYADGPAPGLAATVRDLAAALEELSVAHQWASFYLGGCGPLPPSAPRLVAPLHRARSLFVSASGEILRLTDAAIVEAGASETALDALFFTHLPAGYAG